MSKRVLRPMVMMIAVALSLAACGEDEEGIVLEIDCKLVACEKTVNELVVTVNRPDAGPDEPVFAEHHENLSPPNEFPVSAAMVPKAGIPEDVIVLVEALENGTLVAKREALITWKKGTIQSVDIELYGVQ